MNGKSNSRRLGGKKPPQTEGGEEKSLKKKGAFHRSSRTPLPNLWARPWVEGKLSGVGGEKQH